jgi:hypothetical protein
MSKSTKKKNLKVRDLKPKKDAKGGGGKPFGAQQGSSMGGAQQGSSMGGAQQGSSMGGALSGQSLG